MNPTRIETLYRCDECGWEGPKQGHPNREGRVCWAWSQMQPVVRQTETEPNRTLFIDNPWDEVERTILEVSQDELCDPEGGESAREWSAEVATAIAQRVMQHLEGSEREVGPLGLRKLASS